MLEEAGAEWEERDHGFQRISRKGGECDALRVWGTGNFP